MKRKYENVTDPVCGMHIKHGKEIFSFKWNGKDYAFCQESCRDKFKSSPNEYLKKSWFKKKWESYLKKVQKQTGGNPPCCH